MIPVKVQTRLMGNTFEFIALAPNEEIGHEQIAVGVEEVKRIEKVFTILEACFIWSAYE